MNDWLPDKKTIVIILTVLSATLGGPYMPGSKAEQITAYQQDMTKAIQDLSVQIALLTQELTGLREAGKDRENRLRDLERKGWARR